MIRKRYRVVIDVEVTLKEPTLELLRQVDVDASEREHTLDYFSAPVRPAMAPIEIRARALKEAHDALIADSGLLHALFSDLVRMELNDLDLADEIGFDPVLEMLIERVKNPAARHWLRESKAGDYFIDDTEALSVCLKSEVIAVTIDDLGDSAEGLVRP